MPLQFSFDRVAYTGCIRSLSVLSPYQIVLARGSQVEYFCYREAIKQWILHSSCSFGFIQQTGSFNVPCLPSTINDKADNVCGLSGCLLVSSKDSNCANLKTRPSNPNDEESINHFPFVVFAFGLHFFQMFQFTCFVKSETAQHFSKKITRPVVLTSGQVHLTESRILEVQLILKQIKSTQNCESTTRIWNEEYFKKFHGSLVAVCSAYNSINIYALCFEQDTLHLSVTPALKKINGPSNTLLFSFALTTLVSPNNTSEIFLNCAAGTMDGRILLWTQKLELKYTSSVSEWFQTFSKPMPCKIELTVLDVLNYHVKYDSGGILTLKFFFNGKVLVSTSETRVIKVWKTTQNKPGLYSYTSMMQCHTARVWDIAAFCDDDNAFKFISVGEDSQWFFWDINGHCIYQMKAHVGRGITCVSFPTMIDNSKPPFFVTAGVDGDVKLWSTQFFKNQYTEHQLNPEENLQPTLDKMELSMSEVLENYRDWVRDAVITEDENYIITNFGAVLRILHLSPRDVPFKVDSVAIDPWEKTWFTTKTGRILYIESLLTFPFLLTCISLGHVEQQKYDTRSTDLFGGSVIPSTSFLVMGTVCGKCCLILMRCFHCPFDDHLPFKIPDSMPFEWRPAHSEFSSHHCFLTKLPRWKAVFNVFENIRVQRTFTEPLVSHPSWNLTLGAVQVVAITSHNGFIHIYWVDLFRALTCCSNEETLHTLMSSEERENTGIHHIFSALIAPRAQAHANRIFSFALLPFVSNETSNQTRDSIKLLQLSLFFGDEHGTVSFATIPIFLQLKESSQHLFKSQHELNYYTFLNAEPPSGVESIWLTKRNFCKIHCLRVYPSIGSTINTIYATANDGSLYTCSFHLNGEQSKTAYFHSDSNLAIRKIIKFKEFHVIYDIINFDEEKQSFGYIACFHGSDFIIWCTQNNTEVWRFRCGGSRRPFRIHYVEKTFSEHTLKSFLCASIQRGHIKLRWKSWKERKNCCKQDPIYLVNQPCLSLLGSSHGREIWCAVWLTPSYLCTAGETGSLYEYALKTPLYANSRFEEKQLESVSAHHHSSTALRCVTIVTYENFIFLIFGGAKQYLLLYVYGNHEEKLQSFLLKKWQLSLQHDERISCVSCFFQVLTAFNSSSHLSCGPQPPLCLHIVAGSSSGKVLHEPVYLEKDRGQFKIMNFLETRSSHDVVLHLQQKHSILASLPSGILCSEFQTVVSQIESESTYALYHCGCVNGSTYTYLVSYVKDVTTLTCCYLRKFQAHQVGTTCLAISPLCIFMNTFQENDNTTSQLVREQTPTCTFYLASGGDDNSVTLQHLQLTLRSSYSSCQILHMTRIPRAHISSVRGLCWSDHLLVSVGWDKKLRFWKYTLTTCSLSSEFETTNQSNKTWLVDLPFFQQTSSCLSLELLHSTSTQIGDTAGLAVISREASKTALTKSCVALRLAVFGAHGIEVIDTTLKS